ncbi:MAG: tyrosine--tRNA ligase [Armatimonadota bacterium]
MNPQDLSPQQQVEWLKAGGVDIVPEADLVSKLIRSRETGRPLRVKLGMDPTAPDIHLGHTVVLRKLKQFQDLGHELFLIIGDFTAIIGDPTGKSETRKPLTEEEVRENARTYQEQVFKVLDPERTHIVYNNDWLGAMNFADVVKLTSRFTVARLLERDDFSKRFAQGRPIAVHEFMYAFAQSYDSVHLRADVELGGSDQRFNILMGRDIQSSYGLEQQVAMLMPLLVGTDGSQKMSKSLGNYVGVTEEPQSMFSKIMSVDDGTMGTYYDLLSAVPPEEWKRRVAEHPMEAKKQLAAEIVTTYHSADAATEARAEWERVHSRRELPQEMPEVALPADLFNDSGRVWIARLLTGAGLVNGSREARRMVEQGAVSLDGERVESPDAEIDVRDGMVVQVGRRKFARLRRP